MEGQAIYQQETSPQTYAFSKEILTILQDAGFMCWDANQDTTPAPPKSLPRPSSPTPFPSSKRMKTSLDSERTVVTPMDIDDDRTMRSRIGSFTTCNRSEISLQTLKDDTFSTISKAPTTTTTTTTKTRTVKPNPFAKADFTMRRRINVNASSGSAVRRRSWVPWGHDANTPQIPLPKPASSSQHYESSRPSSPQRTASSSSDGRSHTSTTHAPRHDPYFNPHPTAHCRAFNPSTAGIAPSCGQSRLRRSVRRVGRRIKDTVRSAFSRRSGSENDVQGYGRSRRKGQFDERLAMYTMTPSAMIESPATSGFFEAYIAQRKAEEENGRNWVAPISIEAYERRGSWIDEYERSERRQFTCPHPYCNHHRGPGIAL